jgi:hypothetical protein
MKGKPREDRPGVGAEIVVEAAAGDPVDAARLDAALVELLLELVQSERPPDAAEAAPPPSPRRRRPPAQK